LSKVFLVVLMVVPIFPAFAQAVSAQDALITLPADEELSDIALSQIEGEQVGAMLIGCALGGLTELGFQMYDILHGSRERIEWKKVGLACLAGACAGYVGYKLTPFAQKIDKFAKHAAKLAYVETKTFVTTVAIPAAKNFAMAVKNFVTDTAIPTLERAFSSASNWFVDKYNWFVDKIRR